MILSTDSLKPKIRSLPKSFNSAGDFSDRLKSKKDDLVSIITPAHNSAPFIRLTIESVLSQTHQNWELIVIDDHSTDDTSEIVAQYADRDARIRMLRLQGDRGAAKARSFALKNANGRYMAFLDSDDLWVANKLERQLQFMERNDCAFTFSSYELIDESGDLMGTTIKVPKLLSYRRLLRQCPIGCLTVMFDSKKIGRVVIPDYHRVEDYAMWLQILRDGSVAYGIQDVLAHYRVRKQSLSSNKFEKVLSAWKMYREREQLSVIQTLYCLLRFAFYRIRKYRS